MGSVIDFEGGAVASLKRRMAEVEEANQDLIAFARGHSGAVSSIHTAVLALTDSGIASFLKDWEATGQKIG